MPDSTRILIVGGVAGGASAAARARRLSESAEIILFERGEYVSFANCGLPYHIGGAIHDRQRLLVQTPESLRTRFRLDVRIRTEVIAIHRDRKAVTARDLATGREYEERYDILILSPGAEPSRPPIPGARGARVFTLRTMADMDRIKAAVDAGPGGSAVVVGAGYIGLELAEALRERGMRVILVELAPQVMVTADPEMTALIRQQLSLHGVDLRLNTSITSISGGASATGTVRVDSGAVPTANGASGAASSASGSGGATSPGGEAVSGPGDTGGNGTVTALLSNGEAVTADFIVLSVGVRPETTLARAAGLDLGATGGIKVDEHMRTSDPAIFAVGDAVEITDPITGMPGLVPLAGPANRQGRIAADNALGRDSTYRGTQGTAICKIFDMTIGMTGMSEKLLRTRGLPFEKVYIHPANHATYYPGAAPVSLKLLFDPRDGRLLGAQAVGTEGIDKRIDVLATAIRAGMTVFDLEHLELSYAPPYGSAKDPVNYAGFVAANVLRGDVALCHYEDVANPGKDRFILDVRTLAEAAACTIPGATVIPLDELRGRLNELPRDKELLVVCQAGLRGYIACRILMQHGFRCRNLSGGFKTYANYSDTLAEPFPPDRDMRDDTGEYDTV